MLTLCTKNKSVVINSQRCCSMQTATIDTCRIPRTANPISKPSSTRTTPRTARIEVVVAEEKKDVVSVVLDESPFVECRPSFDFCIGQLTGQTGTLFIFEVRTIYGLKRVFGYSSGHFEPGDLVVIRLDRHHFAEASSPKP